MANRPRVAGSSWSTSRSGRRPSRSSSACGRPTESRRATQARSIRWPVVSFSPPRAGDALARYLVGLDKRYETEIHLGTRTTTGDAEGEVLEETEIATRDQIEALEERSSCRFRRLPRSRSTGSVPTGSTAAASPSRCRCGGDDPLARDPSVRAAASSSTLEVSSGTYIRAIADALGGHCGTLRRNDVGPFRVEDARRGRSCRRSRRSRVSLAAI